MRGFLFVGGALMMAASRSAEIRNSGVLLPLRGQKQSFENSRKAKRKYSQSSSTPLHWGYDN